MAMAVKHSPVVFTVRFLFAIILEVILAGEGRAAFVCDKIHPHKIPRLLGVGRRAEVSRSGFIDVG